MALQHFAGALRSGTTLQGRWRVGLRIAGSARTTIYSAVDAARNHVAIEVLDAGLVDDLPTRRSFVEAGFQANAIGHAAIARVIEVGSIPDGAPCLVLDLREGEGLEPYRQGAGGTLEASEVVDLFVQLLDALAAAHERSIVHGDIRTTSLFIEVDGRLRVLDFGFASGASDDVATARADVRAAAATAFLLLTGKAPDNGASEVLESFASSLPRVFIDVMTLALGPWDDARTAAPELRRALANVHPRSTRRPRPAVAGPNEQTRELRSLDPEAATALLRDDGSGSLPTLVDHGAGLLSTPALAPEASVPSVPKGPLPVVPSARPLVQKLPNYDGHLQVDPRAPRVPGPAPVPTFPEFSTDLGSMRDLGVSRGRANLRKVVVAAVFLVIAGFVLASLASR